MGDALPSQGSEAQLKEVWEKSDHMDPNSFDPKTFFKMHGKHCTASIFLIQATVPLFFLCLRYQESVDVP